MPEICII